MKRLLLALLLTQLSACGTFPDEDQYWIPMEHFGRDNQLTYVPEEDYRLQPADTIDILFHFNTLSDEVYLVAPHDRLEVKFLSASEYDAIHSVRPDGFISLPFVGDMKVAGLSVSEIQSKITKRYKPVLKDPQFFVTLAEYQVHIKQLKESLNHPTMGQARLLVVREDSKVTFPLLGDISVKNKTVETVKAEASRLYANQAPGMSVDVLLQKTHPRQIYVFGEVNNPGGHLVHSNMSLFQAVALAGGPTREAEMDTVIAMTKRNGEMQAQVYNLKQLLNGKTDAAAAILSPEDVLYIPRDRLSTTAQVVRSISEIMMFRGIGVTVSYSQTDNDETRIISPAEAGSQ